MVSNGSYQGKRNCGAVSSSVGSGNHNRRGEFRRWSFGSGLARSSLWREQFVVLALYEQSMEVQDRGRPQDDGGAKQAGRTHESGT